VALRKIHREGGDRRHKKGKKKQRGPEYSRKSFTGKPDGGTSILKLLGQEVYFWAGPERGGRKKSLEEKQGLSLRIEARKTPEKCSFQKILKGKKRR